MIAPSAAIQSYLRDPDVQRMLRVQQGDQQAYAELVAHYRPWLVRWFYGRLKCWETAEDLSQEVFLRVFRSRENYRPMARFQTWLFTIAGNLALSYKRGVSRRPEVGFSTLDFEQQTVEQLAASNDAGPFQNVEQVEAQTIVLNAVDELNDRQRIALTLSKFQDYSYAEVAREMQTSPQGVKGLLARAIVKLRSRLSSYVA